VPSPVSVAIQIPTAPTLAEQPVQMENTYLIPACIYCEIPKHLPVIPAKSNRSVLLKNQEF